MRPRAFFLGGLVAVFTAILPLPLTAASKAKYADKIAEAERLMEEDSLALARDAYTAALKLAPDPEARRWCELWTAYATWRADEEPDGWDARERWGKRHEAAFTALLKPYDDGRPRDGFWVMVMKARAELRDEALENDDAVADHLAIADYYLAQSPTAEAAGQFLTYLKESFPPQASSDDRHFAACLRIWQEGVRLALSGEDRAWCLLRLAGMQYPVYAGGHATCTGPAAAQSPVERAAFWQDVLQKTAGTAWAPHARALEFIWRVSSGWDPDSAEPAPADVASQAVELEAVAVGLEKATPDIVVYQARNAFERFRKAWDKPVLLLSGGGAFAPDDSVEFSLGEAGLDRVEIQVYRHELQTWVVRRFALDGGWNPQYLREPPEFLKDYVPQGQEFVGPLWAVDWRKLFVPAATQPTEREWALDLPGAERRIWHTQRISVSPQLAPGCYTLVVRGDGPLGDKVEMIDFVVSDLRAMAVLPGDDATTPGEVFLFNASSGQPLANTEVEVAVAAGGKPISVRTKTDEAGRAILPPVKRSDSISFRPTIVACACGVQVATLGLEPEYGTGQAIVSDLILDRPLYRPGETVHWKIVAREWGNGRFEVFRAKLRLTVEVEPTEQKLVDAAEFALNAFGSAHGEFALPAALRPGSVNIDAEFVDEAGATLGWASVPEAFRIDNYVVPAVLAGIELASGPDSLRPGREAVFRATAQYFSGGPVAGARTECEFSLTDTRALEEDEGVRDALQTWIANLGEQKFAGTTDAAGQAEFRLPLSSALPEFAKLHVQVSVLPEGAPAAFAATDVTVTTAGAVLDVGDWTQRQLARVGDATEFRGIVRDGSNAPMTTTGEARLVEHRWIESWVHSDGRVISGEAVADVRRAEGLRVDSVLPMPWQLLFAGYVDTNVAQKPIATKGDGTFAVSFETPRAGLFEMQVWRDGLRLPATEAEAVDSAYALLALDDAAKTIALPPNDAMVVVPGVVRAGEKLRIGVVSAVDEHRGWLVLRSEEAPRVIPFSLGGRAGVVDVIDLPRFAGVGSVQLVTPANGVHYVGPRAGFSFIDDSAALTVVADPASVEARPGATSSITLRVEAADHTPTPVEWSIAVTDESVHQLAGEGGELDAAFADYSALTGASIGLTPPATRERPKLIADPRPAAKRNATVAIAATYDERLRSMTGMESGSFGGSWFSSSAAADADEETVVLSPFEVDAAQDTGYRASNTLAGSRIYTDGGARAAALHARMRRQFLSTAFWAPEIAGDQHGEARVEFAYPDNLTKWRVDAYAVGADGNTFGRVQTFTRTSLPLQARLQTPRGLIAGDTAEFSGLLVNRTDVDMDAAASLTIDGPLQIVQGGAAGFENVHVPKQAEAQTSWSVRATEPGSATIKLTGDAGTESDAMELALPVWEDGLMQDTAASGRLAAGERRRRLKLSLPTKLDRTRTAVALQLSGSHAAALLDALPYLIDFPYGCVEQTMSRFLPAVLVKKTLVDFGLDVAAVEKRVLLHESAADRRRREKTAGFAKLDEVLAQSLTRLDGAYVDSEGFGWWPGAAHADFWMTAYVVWGLAVANEAGIELPSQPSWDAGWDLNQLIKDQAEADDRLAWALAASARNLTDGEKADDDVVAGYNRTYAARDKLSAAGRACLALAAVKFGDDEQRAVLLRNLENGAQRVKSDDLGDTVHWGATGNYWRAMDGAVESTALTLLALLELDPKHPLIEPAVNWLVLNRRSAHWASTRDTAFAILALTKFIATRGELDADAEVDVLANGKKVQRVKFTRESLLAGDTTIAIDPKLLRGGTNTIELRRVGGKSPVYAVARASSWARGDAVKPQGHLINVARGFVRQKQEPTLLGTLRITPEPLPADGKANAAIAGEQVTARVTLNVPNELEYVMVEVPKPAGCEPLNPLSGYDARLRRVDERPVAGLGLPAEASAKAGEAGAGVNDPGYSKHGSAGASPSIPEEAGRPIYREEHDDKSVFFIDALAAGTWEIRFSLRATTPGEYRALPAEASAMYVPEVRANSDAQRVRIERRADGS